MKKLYFIILIACLILPLNSATNAYAQGGNTALPLSGRWSGGKKTNPAIYYSNGGVFSLRYANMNEGYLQNIVFGSPAKSPIAGDWNGDGSDTIGFYDNQNARFYLRNANSTGFDDINFQFGNPGNNWVPVAGDWDGNKTFGVGLYDQSTGRFFLRNSLSTGPADYTFYFGPTAGNPIPIAGDWDGDGKSSVGVFVKNQGIVYLTNKVITSFADYTLYFGSVSMSPLVGDWDGNGTYTIGMYDPSTALLHLRNSNTTGFPDIVINYSISSVITPVTLSYFGYYNTNGAGLDGTTQYMDEIATDINNSNMLHILVDAYNNDIWQTNLQTLLNKVRALGRYKAIVNISRVTWESFELEGPYIPLRTNWQARTDQLLGILDQYTDVVYTLYYDEPFHVGRTMTDFRLVTSYMRTQRPNLRQMAIEYGGATSSHTVSESYFEYMTDIGIDYYYTFPDFGNGNFEEFRSRYEASRSFFTGKRVWIIPEGWTIAGTDSRNLTDALNEYYSFATYNQSRDNIVGILSFSYPVLDFGAGHGFVRDYVVTSSPKYDANFRTISMFIGRRISGISPDVRDAKPTFVPKP